MRARSAESDSRFLCSNHSISLGSLRQAGKRTRIPVQPQCLQNGARRRAELRFRRLACDRGPYALAEFIAKPSALENAAYIRNRHGFRAGKQLLVDAAGVPCEFLSRVMQDRTGHTVAVVCCPGDQA